MFTTLLVVAAGISTSDASGTTPSPTIRSATVYGDCARITESIEVEVDGRQRIVLPPLPRGTAPDSIHVDLRGGHIALDAVDVVRLRDTDVEPDDLRRGTTTLRDLKRRIALATFEDASIGRVVGLANEGPALPDADHAPGWTAADPTRWRPTLAFLRSWSARLDDRRAKVEAEIATLHEQRRLAILQADHLLNDRVGRLRVSVHLVGRGHAQLDVSFLVSGAGWTPRYELRLDPGRDEVALSLTALVKQETGEPWTETQLTFSTAAPLMRSLLPVLPRWQLGEAERFMPAPTLPPEPGELASIDGDLEADDGTSMIALLRRGLLRELGRGTSGGNSDAGEQSRPVLRTPAATPPGGPGTLTGSVYDQTGQPIKGVKIRIRRHDGGSLQPTYTNDEGAFRFSSVSPGTYEVEASAPKLRSVVQRDIRVGEQGSAEVDLVMEIENATEEVKVVERAPVVSTTSARVQGALGDTFVDTSEPGGRRAVEANIGARTGGAVHIRGGGKDQSQFLRDGFYANGQKIRQRSLSAFESQTAGYGAESSTAAGGGVKTGATIALSSPVADRHRDLPEDHPTTLAGGRDLRFAASAPETIPSADRARRIPLGTWSWPVAVERRLIPSVRPEAYLVASLSSQATTPLPAGPAALFLDSQPVGQARLPLVRPDTPVVLPLGIDQAVTASRRVQLDTAETGLISKEETNRYTVTIDVANPYHRPIFIEVIEAVPEGREGVHRDIGLVTLGGTIDPKKGLCTWRARLEAGATRQFVLGYTLRRPAGHSLIQLGHSS